MTRRLKINVRAVNGAASEYGAGFEQVGRMARPHNAARLLMTLMEVEMFQRGMKKKMGPDVIRPHRVLQLNDVCRLESLRSPYDFELDGRTFLKATITVSLDRRKVDEDVLTTLPLDETIPLAGVEPLNGSLLTIVAHVYFYSLLIVRAVSSVLHFRG